MIRLIASDMDGSLLNDEKLIPPEFYDILPQLRQNGISFTVASGRSYSTLKSDFAKVSDQISYICDNGAYVVNHGTPKINTIPRELLKPLLKACDELDGIQVLLCGMHASYLKRFSSDFEFEIGHYYINRKIVERLSEVEDDIFKVAICDLSNPLTRTYPYLKERFGGNLTLQVSGKDWMDVMNKGVNKGAALEVLQRELGVTSEETMAFGDFYNDIELLQKARYSFVMENSNPDMRRHGNYVAPSNNDAGVIQAIKRYVLSPKP